MAHWFRKPTKLRGWLAVTAAMGSAALFPINALAAGGGYWQATIDGSGTPCLAGGSIYPMALYVEGVIMAAPPWVGSFDTTGTVTVPAGGGCLGPSTVSLHPIPPSVVGVGMLTCGPFTGTLTQTTAGLEADLVLTAACIVNGSAMNLLFVGSLAYSAGSGIYNGEWTSS